jgi:heat shock protein HslJ
MTVRLSRPNARSRLPGRLRTVGLVVMVTMAAMVAAGCEDTGIGAGELADRTFVATDLEGASLADGTALTLAFSNDALTASAGCNAIRTDVETSGDTLDVSDLVRSDLACPGDVASLEEWLVEFLAEQPTIDVADGTLTLSASSGRVTAVEVG